MSIAPSLGSTPNILNGLANLSWLWRVRGEPERAVRLIGVGEALSANSGVRLQPQEQAEHDRHVTVLRAQLGDETFRALCAEGRAMDMEPAIEYALAERPI